MECYVGRADCSGLQYEVYCVPVSGRGHWPALRCLTSQISQWPTNWLTQCEAGGWPAHHCLQVLRWGHRSSSVCCLLSSPPSWWRDGQWADWSPTGWLRDCAGSAQFSSGHARGDISARCVHRYHTALSQWNLCPASAAVVKEVLSYQLSIVMIALSSSLCCDVRLPAEMTSHSYNWASVVIRLCREEINNFDGSPSDQTQIIILQSQDISCSCNQLHKPQLWLFIFMAKLTLIEDHQEI